MNSGDNRTLAIGLDGFEISIARKLAAEGVLPFFARLFNEAATFDLDHGDARDTGLAWEHFSSGKHPDDYGRWSAVHFDPTTYNVFQEPTRETSFTHQLPGQTLVFDLPYHKLGTDDGNLVGIADWGAHDPGVQSHSAPQSLLDEVVERFGSYPASDSIYGFVWPCADRARRMAEQLLAAARMRSEIAYWLTEERLRSWNLAIIVTSELHSAVEALWHGWDANHPLHGHPSAAPARDGLRALYIETDKMLAGFAERFPDARMVVFAMHGMGPNKADVISMALLPELLYRLSKGRPALNSRSDWLATGGFSMRRDEDWSNAVNACLTLPERVEPAGWQKKLRATWNRVFRQPPDDGIPSECLSLSWMPSTRYQAQWPLMNAFAIPSFYDGQIRVNLAGREAAGTVTLADYPDFLGQLENELRKLTDAATGLPVVAATSRPLSANPLAANPTQCDLKITWACNALAINHPEAGKIGPLPYRRTGGHTGKSGFAALLGCGLNKGFAGTRNSMDIMPTIAELAGASAQQLSFSGRSLLGIDDQAS